jgi:hypothetical protein
MTHAEEMLYRALKPYVDHAEMICGTCLAPNSPEYCEKCGHGVNLRRATKAMNISAAERSGSAASKKARKADQING